MKFGFIFNVLALTGFSRLLALPKNNDNYPTLTPSHPDSNPVDSHQEGQDDSKSTDDLGSSCQKDWESHYHQSDNYPVPVNNDDSYPNNNEEGYPVSNDGRYFSTAEINPYYIWSPRPRWGRYSSLNRRNTRPSGGTSPYYIWSPRPHWGRYSTEANDEEHYSDNETNSHHLQQTNARYGHPASQKPARYSSGEHVQLHG
ncbi:hypothetical protein CONCODRAFT_7572 [Conidiobolus coronatus NRRL 28638]|uniref:Uncharacterized protein n=1 Tax=Conidiobolus coronatus (strain ATCC 28846 / CBS 209.66 / NRRL 28638) TaxID=796925 RepID=A0A137P4I2_CONC2|nr:hypothetical protein CONCODRAFT_7572 [Conidiobolus coronatus NRRL 28638]|eukprot:KXN69927.1 hypothetical protein CONCODRAFT_7572 [Conidiobolus coronatus NRRL 28638]